MELGISVKNIERLDHFREVTKMVALGSGRRATLLFWQNQYKII